jgi:hypothetical protein
MPDAELTASTDLYQGMETSTASLRRGLVRLLRYSDLSIHATRSLYAHGSLRSSALLYSDLHGLLSLEEAPHSNICSIPLKAIVVLFRRWWTDAHSRAH